MDIVTLSAARSYTRKVSGLATPILNPGYASLRQRIALPPFTRYAGNPIFFDELVLPEGPQFLSVIRVADVLDNPIDSFYMYLAPHDSGSAIWLATAPDPLGPWTLYGASPVFSISNSAWASDHVSSPDVLWVPEEGKFYMYFHGVLGTVQPTGLATSEDGVTWTEKVATPVMKAGTFRDSWYGTSWSYTRVVRQGNLWVSIAQCNGNFVNDQNSGTLSSSFGVAYSEDGINWLQGSIPAYKNKAGNYRPQVPALLPWANGFVVFYLAANPSGVGPICALYTEDVVEWSDLGEVLPMGEDSWEAGGIVGPYPFVWKERLYLYYGGFNASGTVSKVGVAVAELKDVMTL